MCVCVCAARQRWSMRWRVWTSLLWARAQESPASVLWGSGPTSQPACSSYPASARCTKRCWAEVRHTHTHTHTRAQTHTHTHRHTLTYTHTHTHTHTHVGFCGLRGLSIGVMVFILYNLYVLLPYTYPTPKLSPHRRLCASLDFQKNTI